MGYSVQYLVQLAGSAADVSFPIIRKRILCIDAVIVGDYYWWDYWWAGAFMCQSWSCLES